MVSDGGGVDGGDGGGGGYDGDGSVLWCGRGWWWCEGPDNPIEGQSGVRCLSSLLNPDTRLN